MRNPVFVDMFLFSLNAFLEIIGSGNRITDRLCAFRFFRNVTVDTLLDVMPGYGIEVICNSFVELDLASDNDEFLGLLCHIVVLWTNKPTCDISALVNYLENIATRDIFDNLLDLYYDC
jgi:hypothetical protein